MTVVVIISKFEIGYRKYNAKNKRFNNINNNSNILEENPTVIYFQNFA